MKFEPWSGRQGAQDTSGVGSFVGAEGALDGDGVMVFSFPFLPRCHLAT